MDSIRKFFDKKKKDVKFKQAGKGIKLAAPSSHYRPPTSGKPQSVNRGAPTSESLKAGEAALARFETHGPKEIDWSLQAIKAQARKEIEAEKKLAEINLKDETIDLNPKEVSLESAPMLAVQGVYFTCPLIGPEVDTYDVIKSRIKDLLYSQLGEDKGVAACLIIHTCNKNKEKITICMKTLCTYINNIIINQKDEKFRKIRKSNKVYQERVASMEGTKQFLEAAGFETQIHPFNDTTEEFWVLPESVEMELLESLRNALVSAEPLKPQLDRSLKVLLPVEASARPQLPPEFFAMTPEELKKEQQLKSETVDSNLMLMTKVMREKMEIKEIRKYRFTLFRIKFPDGTILQGTFAVNELFHDVVEFVRDNLVNGWRPFFLTLGGGGKIKDEQSTLFDLCLVPAILLNFTWDDSLNDPMLDDSVYLTDDVLMLLHRGTNE